MAWRRATAGATRSSGRDFPRHEPGTNHCEIFLDDSDRKTFLTLLGSVVAHYGWTCHAFCLMTNHYHLIVETGQPALSRGMKVLNGRYVRAGLCETAGDWPWSGCPALMA